MARAGATEKHSQLSPSAHLIIMTQLAVAAALAALAALPAHASPDRLDCSRSIAPGATIMGGQVMASSATKVRLVKDGGAIECGAALTPGDSGLGFVLSGPGEQGLFLIEAVASLEADVGANWGIADGSCFRSRATTGRQKPGMLSHSFTVPGRCMKQGPYATRKRACFAYKIIILTCTRAAEKSQCALRGRWGMAT